MTKHKLFLIALQDFAKTQTAKEFINSKSQKTFTGVARLSSVRIMRNYVATTPKSKGVGNV